MEKTTIQISESLRRRIKVFAAMRGARYDDVLQDFVDFFELSIPFKSEDDFAKFFEANLERFGFRRVLNKRYPSYPDYRVEDLNGDAKEVELELFARDFERHRHDPSRVDYIVALFSTEDHVSGVPVLSVLKPDIIRDLIEHKEDVKHVMVSIPKTLHRRMERLIKDTGFGSVSEYVVFVLREVVASIEAEKAAQPFSEEDVERVKSRLRALGYL